MSSPSVGFPRCSLDHRLVTFVCPCVCCVLCLYVYAYCIVCMCVCVCQCQCPPQLIPTSFFESGSLADFANWLASKPLGSPSAQLPQCKGAFRSGFLHEFWESTFGASGLCGKLFTNGAVSLAHMLGCCFFFSNGIEHTITEKVLHLVLEHLCNVSLRTPPRELTWMSYPQLTH